MQNIFFDGGLDVFTSFEKINRLQLEAGEQLAKSHTALWSDLVSESIAYTDAVVANPSVGDFIKAQQAFLDSVTRRISDTTEGSMGVLSDTNDKISALFSGVASSSAKSVAANVSKSEAPKQPKQEATKQESPASEKRVSEKPVSEKEATPKPIVNASSPQAAAPKKTSAKISKKKPVKKPAETLAAKTTQAAD